VFVITRCARRLSVIHSRTCVHSLSPSFLFPLSSLPCFALFDRRRDRGEIERTWVGILSPPPPLSLTSCHWLFQPGGVAAVYLYSLAQYTLLSLPFPLIRFRKRECIEEEFVFFICTGRRSPPRFATCATWLCVGDRSFRHFLLLYVSLFSFVSRTYRRCRTGENGCILIVSGTPLTSTQPSVLKAAREAFPLSISSLPSFLFPDPGRARRNRGERRIHPDLPINYVPRRPSGTMDIFVEPLLAHPSIFPLSFSLRSRWKRFERSLVMLSAPAPYLDSAVTHRTTDTLARLWRSARLTHSPSFLLFFIFSLFPKRDFRARRPFSSLPFSSLSRSPAA